MKFVGYYRVSTRKQSRSGLGLEAQQQVVRSFTAVHGELMGEFTEVESGKNDERLELHKAMNVAKRAGAALIIARLDRFSRRVSFIAAMMEKGVKLVVAEMPNATDFQLHIFAALAQEERRMISERTKAALAQAKKRGTVLGTHGQALALANKEKADLFATGIIDSLPVNWQTMQYSVLARHLNHRGALTSTGRRFFPQTIKNVVHRLLILDRV